MNTISLLRSPGDVNKEIAQRMVSRRKGMRISQQELARRSQVSLGSIKRFEQTGEISLTFLIRIAVALDCIEDFDALFARRQYTSIEEIIRDQT